MPTFDYTDVIAIPVLVAIGVYWEFKQRRHHDNSSSGPVCILCGKLATDSTLTEIQDGVLCLNCCKKRWRNFVLGCTGFVFFALMQIILYIRAVLSEPHARAPLSLEVFAFLIITAAGIFLMIRGRKRYRINTSQRSIEIMNGASTHDTQSESMDNC